MTAKRVSLAVAAAWLVFAVMSLQDYGVTIDAPTEYYAGDRTLYWSTHPFEPEVLNLAVNKEPKDFRSAYTRSAPWWGDVLHYPVMPSFLGSLSAKIFHDTLGWLTDLDAHHLGLIFLHVIGLYFFGLYACRLFGLLGGSAALLALALSPHAVGHAFNNPKDWPCALYYGLAIMAAGAGIIDRRWRDLIAGAIFLGLSFAAKMNGIFAFATLLAFAPIAYLLLYRRQQAIPLSIVASFLGAPYLVAAIAFILWPWLYQGSPADWVQHVAGYVEWMIDNGQGARGEWTDYSLRILFFTTPPALLAFLLFYFAYGRRPDARARAVWWLVVLWLAVPILRIAMPHSNFYDADRHFLEYIPAVAAAAGGGVARFAIVAHRTRLVLGAALASLLFAVGFSHPYESSYFNALIGGLGGAQRAHLFSTKPPHDQRTEGTEGDYWFSSLRAAMRSFRDTRQPGQTLGLCGNACSEQAVQGTWPSDAPLPTFVDAKVADYLYITNRGTACATQLHDELARGRPIVSRADRDGGVIYVLFGPRR